MTDTNNAPATETKAKKQPTTLEGMDARRIFSDSTSALAYLQACAERFTDFNDTDQTIIIGQTDSEGGLDTEKFDADGFETMVATLKERGAPTLKAVVVTAIPTMELLLSTDEGSDFVREIIRKELNHRAVRQLRVAENPATMADQIPYSVTSFISSSRGDAGIIETFNELYKDLNDTMGRASKAWKRRKLTKSDLRAALESKAFALDNFPELEDSGKNGSLFEMALKLGIATAEKKGLDSTIFARWIESRATAAYEPEADEDEELNFDSLAEAMLTEEEEPAAEGDGADSEATTEPAPAE